MSFRFGCIQNPHRRLRHTSQRHLDAHARSSILQNKVTASKDGLGGGGEHHFTGVGAQEPWCTSEMQTVSPMLSSLGAVVHPPVGKLPEGIIKRKPSPASLFSHRFCPPPSPSGFGPCLVVQAAAGQSQRRVTGQLVEASLCSSRCVPCARHGAGCPTAITLFVPKRQGHRCYMRHSWESGGTGGLPERLDPNPGSAVLRPGRPPQDSGLVGGAFGFGVSFHHRPRPSRSPHHLPDQAIPECAASRPPVGLHGCRHPCQATVTP